MIIMIIILVIQSWLNSANGLIHAHPFVDILFIGSLPTYHPPLSPFLSFCRLCMMRHFTQFFLFSCSVLVLFGAFLGICKSNCMENQVTKRGDVHEAGCNWGRGCGRWADPSGVTALLERDSRNQKERQTVCATKMAQQIEGETKTKRLVWWSHSTRF